MKILFLGDVMGRAGRTAVLEALPGIRERLKLDFVIVNAENSAAGFGMTSKIGNELFEAGADCITLGDHAFDQKDMMSHISTDPRIIRPLNYAKSAPGAGAHLFDAPRGKKVLVMQALGRVFMRQPFDCPFSVLEAQYNKMAHAADAVIIDFHAEVTSETMAMGHYFDGKASLVVGTHTHVPTADTQILPRGTAFQSDAGMCGDYDSVIGMDKAEPMRRFVTGMQGARFTPAEGPATICGVYVETDNTSKRATRVSPFRLGGRLAEIIPDYGETS